MKDNREMTEENASEEENKEDLSGEKKTAFRLFLQEGKVPGKYWISAILAVVACFVLLHCFSQVKSDVIAFSPESGYLAVHSIADGEKLTQVFTSNTDNITGIDVMIGTYIRTNSFSLKMQIMEFNSEKVLYETYIDTTKLVDNAYEQVDCPEIRINRNELYAVSFMAEGTSPSNTIAFYRTEDGTGSAENYALIGTNIQSFNFCVRVRTKDRALNTFISILLIGLVIFCVTSLIFIRKQGVKAEKVFIIITLPLGILYMLVITPLSPPDEPVHYENSYMISNCIMPESEIENYVNRADLDYSGFELHRNVLSGYQRVASEFWSSTKEQELIDISRNVPYPVHYLPQALGITIARLLNRNFVITFLMGRLFNLLFYITCLYFAIKRTPVFQCLFVLIGIIPMTIHQATSYSYDAFVNGMAMLLIASILKEIYGQGKITRSDLLWIMIPGILLAPAKIVYVPLVLLALLIPNERFSRKKEKYIAVLALFAVCIVVVAAFQGAPIGNAAGGSDTRNWEGQHNYTLGFVLQNPVGTVQIFIRTFWSLSFTWFTRMIGSSLSGLSLDVSSWLVFGFIIIIFFSALYVEGSQYHLKRSLRISFLSVFTVVTILIMMSMFLGWTSDTRDIIQGVQGRYFIPVLPLLAMSMNNQVLIFKKRVDNILLSAAILLQAATIVQIISTTLRT